MPPANDQLLATLRRLEFLEGLSDEALRQLSSVGELVQVGQNDTLFCENDLAEDIFLIAQGRVSVVICTPKSGCRSVMEIGEGDLAGWAPLVQRNRLSATAWALTQVSAVRLPGARVLELCEADAKFGYELMRRVACVLADRLSGTRLQLLDISGVHLPEVALESD